MKPFRIAQDLFLPPDFVTESVAILARKRSGKSYTARRLTEQIFKAGQQVVIVDPKGDWWGIRSSADGKDAGLSIVILGGEHGDVPLEPGGGELVARLVVEQRVSVLLDLSGFRKHEVATFMTAFLETLFRLKAQERYRTPMMLMMDEADAIAPQKPYKGEERMLGAAEDVVKKGGQRGIGVCLITQRAAVLNKNVLTQVGILILLRTTGSQDIDQLDAWIEKHAQPEEREAVMQSIAALPTGTAWVWAPGWPDEKGIFKKVQILRIETFDSGATPKVGERRETPKTAADVDLEAFRKEMASTIEKAKAADPKELRKRVADLEAQLKKRVPAAPPPVKPAQVKQTVMRVEVPVILSKDIAAYEKATKELKELSARIGSAGTALTSFGRDTAELLDRMYRKVKASSSEISSRAASTPRTGTGPRGDAPVVGHQIIVIPRKVSSDPADVIVQKPSSRDESDNGDWSPSPAQIRILRAVEEFAYHGVDQVPRAWVAASAGVSHKSSGYANNLGSLRVRGIIEYCGGRMLRNTDKAHLYVGLVDGIVPPTGDEMLERCKYVLSPKRGRILEQLYRAWPQSVPRDTIAEAVSVAASSSGYANDLGGLRSADMIEYGPHRTLRCADWIHMEQGAFAK